MLYHTLHNIGSTRGFAGDGNLPRQFSTGKRSISWVLTHPYHRLGFCGNQDDELMATAPIAYSER